MFTAVMEKVASEGAVMERAIFAAIVEKTTSAAVVKRATSTMVIEKTALQQ